MYNNWSYGPKMLFIIAMALLLVMSASGEEVVNANDVGKEAPNAGASASAGDRHSVAKRAWQQLQGSWGKRSASGDAREESLEELQRRIMRLYAEQLMANNVDASDDYATDDYADAPVDKRAWKQMSNAWGKRDWSQMRGSGWGKREAGNWNNMRGLWGKRNPGWNKLSSAWGK
jgi:hypothetical protein